MPYNVRSYYTGAKCEVVTSASVEKITSCRAAYQPLQNCTAELGYGNGYGNMVTTSSKTDCVDATSASDAFSKVATPRYGVCV